MQFIKNAGLGVQVAVVAGYLAAVGGHNVPMSLDNLNKMFKSEEEVVVLAKHVGGRVLQTPFFLVGMAIGIVMDVISLVVNTVRYTVQAIKKAYADYKKEDDNNADVESPNFGNLHSSLVNPKQAHTYCETNEDPSETPIQKNVTMFNSAVGKAAGKACNYVASFTCSSGTQ